MNWKQIVAKFITRQATSPNHESKNLHQILAEIDDKHPNDIDDYEAIVEAAGKDINILYTCLLSDSWFKNNRDVSNMLKMHDMCTTGGWTAKHPTYLDHATLNTILQRNTKRPLKDFEQARYNIAFRRPGGYEAVGDTTYGTEIYLDAPLGITIEFNGASEAAASFYPTTSDTLVIRQLQGINKVAHGRSTKDNWGLEPLDWKAMLVETVDYLAGKHQYSNLVICSAINNPYLQDVRGDAEHNISLQQALKIYDQTAARLGFEFKDNNWHIAQGKITRDHKDREARYAAAAQNIENEYQRIKKRN